MSWQEAWELYQDTHIDADWYDFEDEYWGDDEEDDEDEEFEDEEDEEDEEYEEYEEYEDEWVLEEGQNDMHPNETFEEFAEHEDFDD